MTSGYHQRSSSSSSSPIVDTLFDDLIRENTRLADELQFERQLNRVLDVYRRYTGQWRALCVCRCSGGLMNELSDLDTKYQQLMRYRRNRGTNQVAVSSRSLPSQPHESIMTTNCKSIGGHRHRQRTSPTHVTADTIAGDDNGNNQSMDDSNDSQLAEQELELITEMMSSSSSPQLVVIKDDSNETTATIGGRRRHETVVVEEEEEVEDIVVNNNNNNNIIECLVCHQRFRLNRQLKCHMNVSHKTGSAVNNVSSVQKMIAVVNNKRNKYHKISDEMRSDIIDRMNSGLSCVRVANMFGLKHSTVSNIYKQFQETGLRTKQPTGHRPRSLTNRQMEIVSGWLDDDCTQTLEQLSQRVLVTFPSVKSISGQTITKCIKDFHISFKRVSSLPLVDNSTDVVDARHNYAVNYRQLVADAAAANRQLIFVGFIAVQIWSRRSSNNITAAERSTSNVTGNQKSMAKVRSRTYGLSCAMSADRVYRMDVQEIAVNTDNFPMFLSQLLSQTDLIGDSVQLIVDNHHNTDAVADIVTATGGHSAVLFLPPFSPFLSPVEELYKHWTTFVRQSVAINEVQLHNIVMNPTVFTDSRQTFRPYVDNTEQYMDRCIDREVIIG